VNVQRLLREPLLHFLLLGLALFLLYGRVATGDDGRRIVVSQAQVDDLAAQIGVVTPVAGQPFRFSRNAVDFDGLPLWVASVEDVMLSKLEWARLGWLGTPARGRGEPGARRGIAGHALP
jgi:hypothetical protein